MASFQELQAELARELLGMCDTLTTPNNFSDPLMLNTEDFFYSDYNYPHLLPFFSSPSDPDLVSISPEMFPYNDHEYCYQFNPKRQRNYCCDDLYCSSFTPCCMNEYFPSSCLLQSFLPEQFELLPSPESQLPMVYGNGNVENEKKPNNGCSSAQSIAARQRRRKITEKTQELGKLIPGGNKMNTAEMLQAAFKYVKYLQAQVGILEFMATVRINSTQLRKSSGRFHVDELQVLASPTIQEKLYSEEKCLVPTEFLEAIAGGDVIQSNSSIVEDLFQFIESKN